jgi:hypothetical protein
MTIGQAPAVPLSRHRQIERTMTLALEAPADMAFPLFGPLREREWDPAWNPVFVAPDDGRACAPGTVFTTAHPHESIWVMTTYDPARHRVRYVMLQPGLVTSEISVDVTDARSGTSAATVRYRRTAISTAGEDALDEFVRVWPAWAAEWQTAINAALARERSRAR